MFGTLNRFSYWLTGVPFEAAIVMAVMGGIVGGAFDGEALAAVGVFLGLLLWFAGCLLLVKFVRPWVEMKAHDEAVAFYRGLLHLWREEILLFERIKPVAVSREQLHRSFANAKGNKDLIVAGLNEFVYTVMSEHNFGTDVKSYAEMFSEAKKLIDWARSLPAESAFLQTPEAVSATEALATS